MLNIKQVLLETCSSRGMQAEGKHKALDQSWQARADVDTSKEYRDSFPRNLTQILTRSRSDHNLLNTGHNFFLKAQIARSKRKYGISAVNCHVFGNPVKSEISGLLTWSIH